MVQRDIAPMDPKLHAMLKIGGATDHPLRRQLRCTARRAMSPVASSMIPARTDSHLIGRQQLDMGEQDPPPSN
jgi:hypothetical protein